MENIHDSVAWYQQKIGSYDKQLWEQSVEQKVLKGIQQAPRRSVRPKTELIDVDLIRGSTFTKAKPQVPWTYITVKTFSRVVLFPFHYKWWIQQTSVAFWLFLLVLYVMQIFTIIVFFNSVGDELFRDELSLSEVAIPCVLMVLLGLIHSQTVLTHLKPPIRDTKRDTWRRKRSLSQNRSVSVSSDLGAAASSTTQNADIPSSQQKSTSKGQSGSRTLRSKDRKVRLKTNNRQSARRENHNERAAQDSESAYNTYEASDSVADRTSSVENETNGTMNKNDRSKNIKIVNKSSLNTSGTSIGILDSDQVVNYENYRKARESQESDFPQDSNSEDDKVHKKDEKCEGGSKRNSQSISSDNEEPNEPENLVRSSLNVKDRTVVETIGKTVNGLVNTSVETAGKSTDDSAVTRSGKHEQNGDKLDVNRGLVNEDAKLCEKGVDALGIDKDVNGASDIDKHVNGASNTDKHVIGASNTDKHVNGASNTDKQVNGASISLDKKIFFEGRSHQEPIRQNVNDARNVEKKLTSTDQSDETFSFADEVIISRHDVSDSSFLEISEGEILSPVNISDSVIDTSRKVDLVGKLELLLTDTATPVAASVNNKSNSDTCMKQQEYSGQQSQELTTRCRTSSLKPTNSLNGGQKLNRSAHSHNSVHFTNDLVNLREITPKSSREGTPTHSQSDALLQSNKHLRTAQKVNNDTDSESDNDVQATKSLPNIRRRKVPSQDGIEVNGTTLRHRRNTGGVVARDSKANSTGVSSSDGETEGQSSEYSRGSRRNMASSEEWGDHLQSDVDTSSETSSCGTEPEISQHEEPEPETEEEAQVASVSSTTQPSLMTTSNLHVINLLHPSTGTSVSHSPPDKVTCIIWERNECKKIELTAMDIGWAIIETVDKIPESSDYILIGIFFSLLMGLTPLMFQAFHAKDLPSLLSWNIFPAVWDLACDNSWRENLIHINSCIQRLCLSAVLFFMLSVADRTFKQRLLYAKHFCYLTSSRRARKFDMPHFRLNKVRNIRIWLSLRSYLKKRGPQRSVDMIVSAAFLLTLIMLILMCLQLLRDAEIYLNYLVNWELLVWCMALGIYLLRFMTLGLRINKKYRNLSVLITEQINLYLQMEQKPHKKEELMVANNVLKLAESLLKELESPFKISGISANPLILNITRVVVLSAFSAVLTELLGFKLKLYKIKLRA